MTNFEIITTYLKHGIPVSVKIANGEHQTLSPTKDKDGRYRASGWCSSLEETKQRMGKCRGYINLEESCKDWTDITPFHLDFEPYPVGMKVVIIASGLDDKIKTNEDGTYQLVAFSGVYSHAELVPCFEEEIVEEIAEENEILLVELERNLKELIKIQKEIAGGWTGNAHGALEKAKKAEELLNLIK